MSVPRGILVLMIITSLSLLGCGSVVAPEQSSTPTQLPAPPSASPSPTAGHSSSPTPSPSIAPSAQAGAWLDAGELHEPRNATNVVLVGRGEVLVVGSDYETSWRSACGASTDGSDAVEIGGPGAGVWKKTTSLPNLRDAPAVVGLPDGRALMTGGAAGESKGWSAFSSTYVFDPTTRVWSRSGLLNAARTETAATVLLDGRVLVAGGLFLDRTSPDQVALDSAELWDPRSGAWTRAGRLAQTRVGGSAVTLADGRVLIVGGSTTSLGDSTPQASAEVYEPTSDRWSAAGTLTTPRSGFILVALPDGGALVAGGFAELERAPFGRLSTVERFDPVSNTWSAAHDLPYPVAGASGILLADGRVLVAGGSVRDAEPLDIDAGTIDSGLTDHATLFDPKTNTWVATPPMPTPRAGASVVLLADGSALVVGGSVSEGEFSTPGCPEAHPRAVRFVPGS
jgi:N-acetylneuraminic acid mutarotase